MNQDFSNSDKQVLLKVIDGLNNPLRPKEESYTEHCEDIQRMTRYVDYMASYFGKLQNKSIEEHENNVYSYVFPIEEEIHISKKITNNYAIDSMPTVDIAKSEVIPSKNNISSYSYNIDSMTRGNKYITKEGYLTEEGMQQFLNSGYNKVSDYIRAEEHKKSIASTKAKEKNKFKTNFGIYSFSKGNGNIRKTVQRRSYE